MRTDDDAAPPATEAAPRLLVADDDPAFRRAISFLLSGSGFEVTEARDGWEALRCIDTSVREHRPFEILCLDIRMVGATGWEVLRHSRESAAPGSEPPRVILVTGYAEEADRIRARREGASGLLQKPIPCETLLHEIARLGRIPRDFPAVHDESHHLTTTA